MNVACLLLLSIGLSPLLFSTNSPFYVLAYFLCVIELLSCYSQYVYTPCLYSLPLLQSTAHGTCHSAPYFFPLTIIHVLEIIHYQGTESSLLFSYSCRVVQRMDIFHDLVSLFPSDRIWLVSILWLLQKNAARNNLEYTSFCIYSINMPESEKILDRLCQIL